MHHQLGICKECDDLVEDFIRGDNVVCPSCRSVDTIDEDIIECVKCDIWVNVDKSSLACDPSDRDKTYVCDDCNSSQETDCNPDNGPLSLSEQQSQARRSK